MIHLKTKVNDKPFRVRCCCRFVFAQEHNILQRLDYKSCNMRVKIACIMYDLSSWYTKVVLVYRYNLSSPYEYAIRSYNQMLLKIAST